MPGILIKIAVLIALIVAGQMVSQTIAGSMDFEITPFSEPAIHRIIMSSMAVYTILMAIPFVPGAEIGITAMVVFGGKIAPLVYLCTQISLLASFLVGRWVPERTLCRLAFALGAKRLGFLLEKMSGLDASQRLEILTQHAPKRAIPYLLQYRYVALMLVIALPGNIVVGGGGGIALIAGMSRIFNPVKFFVFVSIAVAPIPVIWMISG